MSRTASRIAVMDLECSCSNIQAGDHTVPEPEMETIEIGAVVLRRADLEPVDTFERFARPIVHRRLTPFCTELTSITQTDVDAAPTFPVVFRAFAAWLQHWGAEYWASWGDFDAHQLVKDTRRHGIEAELAELPPHVNVKALWARSTGRGGLGLAGAIEAAGLEWQGRAHRGIDDARMVARLLPAIGWPSMPPGAAIRPGHDD